MQSKQLTIRPVRATEIPILYDLICELADYEKMRDQVVSTPESLEIALSGEKPTAEALMAFWEQAPVGFALYFHNFSTFVGRRGLYLEDLYVKPDFRGKGIGKALLARLAKIAVDRNCGRFEWAVLDWNTPSIEFYKSLGAIAMDEWTVYRLSGDSLHNLARESE